MMMCCSFQFLLLLVVVVVCLLVRMFFFFLLLSLSSLNFSPALFNLSVTSSIYIHVFFFLTLVLGSTNIFYYIPLKLCVISSF